MISDTAPEAADVQIQLLRQATESERLARMQSLMRSTRSRAREGIARAHPELDQRGRDLLFVEVHYGRQWANRLRDYFQALGE